MRFQDFKIRTKLFMLIGVLSLVTIIVAGFGTLRITSMHHGITTVSDVDGMTLLGARMNQNLIMLSRSEYRIASDPSEETLTAAAEIDKGNLKLFDERFKQIEAAASPEEKGKLEEIQAAYKAYVAGREKTYEAAGAVAGQVTIGEAQQKIGAQVKSNRVLADKLQALVRAYSDALDARSQSTSETAKSDGQKAIIIMIAVAGVGIVFGVIVGLLLANFSISAPLNRSVDELRKLADGKLETEVTGADRRDECGDIAKGLAIFRENALRARDLEAAAAEQKLRTEAERKADMLKLADDFERSVGGIVGLVSAAATEMQAAATQLTSTAQETSAQSVAVSAAAEEAGTNVTAVAGAAEELGASVSEIGRQVETSVQISHSAVQESHRAAQVVTELNEVASSITSVVDLISGLASQTNLLALNATIESARAGEAGKGFAVVASEVKQLAGQTARATTEISGKVSQIQDATGRAVAAIQSITSTIGEINATSSVIASAVEQQGSATQEIVQAVNQASAGTSEVTANITGVAMAAEQTGAAASQVLSASGELAEQAEKLHREMDSFLVSVRSA